MAPKARGCLQLLVLLVLMAGLLLLFPAALRFVEGAARSVVRLWWLVLLFALGAWLFWGVGRKR